VLIFLDIDGVLRRSGAPLYALEEDCRRAFEDTLRAIPNASVVITSSWREGFSLDEIRAHFSEDIAPRLIGVTPMAQQLDDFKRHREILAYLRHRGAPSPWVAVDDDGSQYPPGCNLVLVDPARGFDSEAAKRLLAASGANGRGT
jgi:Swiss Army Knife RNA repair-like protein